MSVVTITTYTSGSPSRVEKLTYTYDSDGILTGTLDQIDANADGTFETATKTEFLNDPDNPTGYSQVLRETTTDNATGQVQKVIDYTLGLDQISQTTTTYTNGNPGTPQTLVFGYDGHGSTRVLTDLAQNGAIATVGVLQVFLYDAYGNLLNMPSDQAATSLLYSGERTDASTGLQYLRNRWYDPNTGRFNRLDDFFGDIQDPQSLHKYLYTQGDPIRYGDPTGMFEGLVGLLSSMSIGSNVRADDSSASAGVLQLAQTTDKFIRVYTRIQGILNKVESAANLVNDVISLFGLTTGDIKGMLMDLQPVRAALFGLIPTGVQIPPRPIVINLPTKITDQVKELIRILGESNKLAQLIGEFATAAVAYVLGFRAPNLVMNSGPHGIDLLARQQRLGTWGIFEAKGNTSGLGDTNYGKELSGQWITYWLKDTIRRTGDTGDGPALEADFDSRKVMLVGYVRAIFKINSPKQRVFLKVAFQGYRPPLKGLASSNLNPEKWKGMSA